MFSSYFTPETFRFLDDLSANNDRDWFQANKARYEGDVKEPALRFIADFAPHLQEISPHFRADPRANGGSLFRIYRDTRFSKDKIPYKTHTGIHFRHESAKDAHTPGFYLHIEPGGSFVGCGIWRPGSPTLTMIRQAITDDPDAWAQARDDAQFRAAFELSGEFAEESATGRRSGSSDDRRPEAEGFYRSDIAWGRYNRFGGLPGRFCGVVPECITFSALAVRGAGSTLLKVRPLNRDKQHAQETIHMEMACGPDRGSHGCKLVAENIFRRKQWTQRKTAARPRGWSARKPR